MTSRSSTDEVPAGAGHPRLVLSSHGHVHVGSAEATGAGTQHEFLLDHEVSTLGSAVGQDVNVTGLEPEHATIRREAAGDDYVFERITRIGSSHVNGAAIVSAELHHGDRLQLGEVTFVFQRDEFADHGRFDNGRQGGGYAGNGSVGGGGFRSESRPPGGRQPEPQG